MAKINEAGALSSKPMQLKGMTDGGLKAEPPAAGGYEGLGAKAPSRWAIFSNFLKKKLFSCHWITFRTCLEPFKRTRFLTFEHQLKY